MEDMRAKRSNQWMVFIGVILLLFGVYGLARTCINMLAFEKYPQEGVYPPFPFFQSSIQIQPYGDREEDCITNYTYLPYAYGYTTTPEEPPMVGDGISIKRKATEKEQKEMQDAQKAQQELQKQNCLSGVKESREKAKVNDLSQSVLFLFLGAGVLIAKRIFGFDK